MLLIVPLIWALSVEISALTIASSVVCRDAPATQLFQSKMVDVTAQAIVMTAIAGIATRLIVAKTGEGAGAAELPVPVVV